MQGTKLPITAFSVGISGQDGQQADELTQRLAFNVQKAEEMAAVAKLARHRLATHRPNYDRVINQKESKPRRKIINKNLNLEASYTSAVCAYFHFAKESVEVANQLAALMPQLIAGALYCDGTVPTNGRKANAILVSRFITQIPSFLARLEETFIAPGTRGMEGLSALMDLFSSIARREEFHRFKNDLFVPYIKGASREKHFVDLDAILGQLDVEEEKLAHALKQFLDAKARYFAGEWDGPLASTVEAQASVARFNEAAVDYEMAHWSIRNTQAAFWSVLYRAEEVFKQAYEQATRGGRYSQIDRSNLIAVHTRLLQTEERYRFSQRQVEDKSHRKEGCNREENARLAMNEAFGNIPAQLRLTPRSN